MVLVSDHIFSFRYDDQSCANVIHEVWQKTGPTIVTTYNSFHFISSVGCFFTLACRTPYLPFLHYHIFGIQKQDCMNFSVQIKVMPLRELLDPQGKAVMGGLQNLGIKSVQDARIGKNIQLQIEAATPEDAKKIAEDASKKLLANPVMEFFEITLH